MTNLARLKVRREFLTVAQGFKSAHHGLVLQARQHTHRPAHENDPSQIKFGLTVTKKIGNAVIRNRVRRRLRALALEELPKGGKRGFDYVLIGRTATITRSYPMLAKDLKTALKRVHDMAAQADLASA